MTSIWMSPFAFSGNKQTAHRRASSRATATSSNVSINVNRHGNDHKITRSMTMGAVDKLLNRHPPRNRDPH